MRTKKPMILAVMTAIGLLLGLVTFGAGRTMAQVPTTDTDGDGVKDGDEVSAGCNPLGTGALFGFGLSGGSTKCK